MTSEVMAHSVCVPMLYTCVCVFFLSACACLSVCVCVCVCVWRMYLHRSS